MSLQLQQHGYIPRGGQIVDASIVQAPITQASGKGREALNEGKAPEGWSDKQLRHTDRDARWTPNWSRRLNHRDFAIGVLATELAR